MPLLLSDAFNVQAEVPALLNHVHAGFPQLRVIASRPIGPEAQLLSIIDRRPPACAARVRARWAGVRGRG